jgi:hypothetical protein
MKKFVLSNPQMPQWNCWGVSGCRSGIVGVKVYLRFAFVGDAGWSLKSEVQSVLSTSFGVEMKYDGELWSNVASMNLEFDKVQAISDYVLSLGCNYKKNVTKLSEEVLSKIPHFLANVPSDPRKR